jgi:HEAT repeat protein
MEAVEALGRMSFEKQEADPALIEALKDENADVRLTAVECLGALGMDDKDGEPPPPQAMKVMPALIPALKDRHAGVRKEAARSILRLIGAQTFFRSRHTAWRALVEFLSKALTEEEEPVVRCNVCRALGMVQLSRSEARVAIPALRRALKDKSAEVRQAAAATLKQLLPAEKAQP